MKWMFVFFIALSLILAGCSSTPVDTKNYDLLAKCLTDNGATMYGTEWCPHCKTQKALFGDSFQYIDYVDCDKYKDDCVAAGLDGYPTWKIKGTNYAGTQNFYILAEKTGCLEALNLTQSP